MNTPAKNRTPRQGANKSALLFALHLFAGAAFFAAALLVRAGVLRLWPCSFYEMTGLCCLTCGATRAAAALASFQLRRSFLLNPIPLLTAAFYLSVLVHELRCILTKRHRPYKGWVWVVVSIVVVAAVYMQLRNLGLAPFPDAL